VTPAGTRFTVTTASTRASRASKSSPGRERLCRHAESVQRLTMSAVARYGAAAAWSYGFCTVGVQACRHCAEFRYARGSFQSCLAFDVVAARGVASFFMVKKSFFMV
jgi:hypothetical protein